SAGSQACGGLGRRADRQPRHRGDARDRRAAGAHEQGRPDRRPGHPQPAGGRASPAHVAHARRPHRIDQWGTRGSGPVNLTLVVVGVFLVTYAALLVIALRRPLVARLALREALRRPGQSAIVVLGLMVGTVAIFAMQVLGDSFYESQTRGAFLAWGRVDLVAADGGRFFDPRVATALAADPRVSASLAGVQAGVELPSSVVDLDRGNAKPLVMLVGFDPATQRPFGSYQLTDGRTTLGQDLGPDGVLISASLAYALDAHPGGPGLKILESKRQDFDAQVKQVDGTRGLYTALSLFVALAGAALVVNLGLALAEERRPRHAVLRALGLGRAAMVAMSVLEGAVYSLAAAV